VVLVCIMIINLSSSRSTGSQCKNSISLVFVDIHVEVIYFGRKWRPSACFRISIDDDDKTRPMSPSPSFNQTYETIAYAHSNKIKITHLK